MNDLIISQFNLLVKKNQISVDTALSNKDTDEHRKQSFRIRTNKKVLNILKNYPEEITKENYKELIHLDGVGKGSISKIEYILTNGYLEELKDVSFMKSDDKNNIIQDLEKVINIGRSKALELYNDGIKSVNELKSKIKNGEITVNDKILLGLKYYQKFQEKIPRSHIKDIEKFLQSRIKYINKKRGLTDDNKYILKICGSYRRKKKVSGDVDVLITKVDSKSSSRVLNNHLPMILKILKKSWKENDDKPLLIDNMTDITPTKYMGFGKYKDNKPFRIDIRFVAYDSFYSALLYFTGSSEFNKEMRNVAKTNGYKLSEYGLFKDDKKMKITSEEDFFKILKMDYVKPEKRL